MSSATNFPHCQHHYVWEWCYAWSIEESPEDETTSWTIKSDPRSIPDAVIIDGCAMLWTVHKPTSWNHQLSHHTTLPTQNVARNIIHNTVHLILYVIIWLTTLRTIKLNWWLQKKTPVQVWNKFSLQREYLKTNYEEADAIIVHLLVRIAS